MDLKLLLIVLCFTKINCDVQSPRFEHIDTLPDELKANNSDGISSAEFKCPKAYEEIALLNGLKKCVPQCEKECINGFCSTPNYCKCHDGFEHHPRDPYVCILKPTVPTTTPSHVFKRSEHEVKNDSNDDDDDNKPEISTVLMLVSTTTEANENTTTPNTDLEDSGVLTSEEVITVEPAVTEIIIANASCAELNCSHGCFQGICMCPHNWKFIYENRTCVDEFIPNESGSTEKPDNNSNYASSADELQHAYQQDYLIIGYVIIALIIVLGIMTGFIIYLLCRSYPGDVYDVNKYEKKFGHKAKAYRNDMDAEMQDVSLRNGTETNYYDADRFLDDRRHHK